MSNVERRRRRADLISQALDYQLLACCEDGALPAMVVADEDGLALGASGDRVACDEVAAKMAYVGARVPQWRGTLLGAQQTWEVDMARVIVDGSALIVCAIGGDAVNRSRQLARGAQGAARILRAG